MLSLVVGTLNIFLLIAAEAYYFFLDEKVAKNQVSQNASLPHIAFTLQSGKTTAAIFCPAIARTCPRLLQKLLCPPSALRPPLFS
jgi:hypothetical protein